ncbi:imidazole glycerol phosphate synthase subunit HisF [Marivirga lumbricoides]|uniref:Imidazole glycerol phosphate synthase subunit HisF n=1 Tax=Marivirga lumbricoides TaxID=1046115 RepID=A0ABQ1N107_9BACT|nr:imidazole glycerol phosphate synthase subunit HisF [Marivirga lumbricoides]
MLTKRIIPCLDIKNGRTVKGVNFLELRDAGDPVELAKLYAEQGADELVFLDITATNEKRKTLAELVSQVAEAINIPFTVGGGISTVEDVSVLLNAGADKVSINSAAVRNPQIIREMAEEFGSQCIVVAIDSRNVEGKNIVHTHGGSKPTTIETEDWVKQVVELGAGEILLTSMDHDGTKSGFADELLAKVSSLVNVPVIASGGAGNMDHFFNTFTNGKSDAALAASIFHFKEIGVPELKTYLKSKGLEIRI